MNHNDIIDKIIEYLNEIETDRTIYDDGQVYMYDKIYDKLEYLRNYLNDNIICPYCGGLVKNNEIFISPIAEYICSRCRREFKLEEVK